MTPLRNRIMLTGLWLCLAFLAATAPAAAAGPAAYPFSETFVDINPCTGEPHTVTFSGTFFEFDRGNGIEYRIDKVVTTSSGFVGGGTEITTAGVFKVADVLVNADGERMLAIITVVVDPSGTVRVERLGLVCRGRA